MTPATGGTRGRWKWSAAGIALCLSVVAVVVGISALGNPPRARLRSAPVAPSAPPASISLGPMPTRPLPADPAITTSAFWSGIAGSADGDVWALRDQCFDAALLSPSCTLPLADSPDGGHTWQLHPAPVNLLPPSTENPIFAMFADGGTLWLVTSDGYLLTGNKSGAAMTWRATRLDYSGFAPIVGAVVDHRLVMATSVATGPPSCEETRTEVLTVDSRHVVSRRVFGPAAPDTNLSEGRDGSVWQAVLPAFACRSGSGYNAPARPRLVSVITPDGRQGVAHPLPPQVASLSSQDASTAWGTANASGKGAAPVVVSHDGGATWSSVPLGTGFGFPTATGGGNVLLLKRSASSDVWDFWISTDQGAHQSVALEMDAAAERPIVPDPLGGTGDVFLNAGRMYLSIDEGRTWHDQGPLPTRLR